MQPSLPAKWRERGRRANPDSASASRATCQVPLDGRDCDLGHQMTVVRAYAFPAATRGTFPHHGFTWEGRSFLMRIEVGSWICATSPSWPSFWSIVRPRAFHSISRPIGVIPTTSRTRSGFVISSKLSRIRCA